jgi:hypothetical protein
MAPVSGYHLCRWTENAVAYWAIRRFISWPWSNTSVAHAAMFA